MPVLGAIGNQPGELLTYQPTWHHGHAVMRFLPEKHKGARSKEGLSAPPVYKFKNAGGYQFYKPPSASAYKLNKLLYDLRHMKQLRLRLLKDTPSVIAEYGLTAREGAAVETMKDLNMDLFRSLKNHPLVDAGAHPLGMWMAVIIVHADAANFWPPRMR